MTSDETLAAIVAQVYAFRSGLSNDRFVERDDVVQDVAVGLSARTSLPKIDQRGVNCYAFGALTLSMANARRKAGRYDKAVRRYAELKMAERPSSKYEIPLDTVVSAELSERITAALNRLPEDERAEVRRHFFVAQPGAADAGGKAECDRLRRRALRRLRTLLADLAPQRATVVVPGPLGQIGPDRGTGGQSFRPGPAAA